MLELVEFTGTRPVPKGTPFPSSIILAAMHGNEQCGIRAFESLLSELDKRITMGKVLYMVGSPLAVKANKRFIGTDLNRLLRPAKDLTDKQRGSPEYHRSREIMRCLDMFDALLCIHASETPRSPEFAICEENGLALASCLPGEFAVSGFDALCPGGTDAYMNIHDKIGISIECGYIGDQATDDVAAQATINFLTARGHMDPIGELPLFPKTRIHAYRKHLSETDFRHSKAWADFEELPAGTVIGLDGTTEVSAEEDSVILFPDDRTEEERGEECFILARKLA